MMDAVRLRKRWWCPKVAVHKRVSNGVISRIMQRRNWRWVVRCLRMGENALRAITASRKITTRYHSRNLRRREIPRTVTTWLRLGRWIICSSIVSRGHGRINGREIRVVVRRRRGIKRFYKITTLRIVNGLVRGNAALQRFVLRGM
jgi:hypothetical protein